MCLCHLFTHKSIQAPQKWEHSAIIYLSILGQGRFLSIQQKLVSLHSTGVKCESLICMYVLLLYELYL